MSYWHGTLTQHQQNNHECNQQGYPHLIMVLILRSSISIAIFHFYDTHNSSHSSHDLNEINNMKCSQAFKLWNLLTI